MYPRQKNLAFRKAPQKTRWSVHFTSQKTLWMISSNKITLMSVQKWNGKHLLFQWSVDNEKNIGKEAMFIFSSKRYNWSLIPAVKWTSINKKLKPFCLFSQFSEVIIKRNLVKRVRMNWSAQLEYQHIFSVKTQDLLTGFNNFQGNFFFSTQISQYVKLQWVYYTTTYTCSYMCTGNEQYKYLTVNISRPKSYQNTKLHIPRFSKNLKFTFYYLLMQKVVPYH